ncbi:chalcone-flavanone isomerase [mine drainage metagenome]|uniref:Chalcone-flavanone isomerase n=1 Tax=mine drainage metagenome TaxID=410659 RepID=A0A1J5P3F4_9ZZZZ
MRFSVANVHDPVDTGAIENPDATRQEKIENQRVSEVSPTASPFYPLETPMKLLTHLGIALFAGLFALGGLAATQDINGVKVEDSASVAGNTLQLNGAGTRVKIFFKVYVAALYLGQKTHVPDEVTSQSGPKRLSVTMVRDVGAEVMSEALTKGIEDNQGKAALTKFATDLTRMEQIFADQKKLMTGDNFLIDWIPGSGTVITVKGKVQGEPFKDADFYAALMSVWLGASPVDDRLKTALLGGQ